MGRSKEDIYKELSSKLPVAMEGGGYIYHSDHSIPPNVSLENYSYVIELVKELGTFKT